ncbi:right-handed parallel beta-helix repeat-containing protein [bacterium]|nr:right-handed parallel beta-helix repeat-containing protein [bacterium]
MKTMKLGLVMVFVAMLAAQANAARYYVKGSAGASGTGLSWGEAKKTVAEAMNLAGNGDEVWVAAGTYAADSTNTLVVMKSGVSIYGGFAGTETSLTQRNIAANPTILDGANMANHVVSADYVTTAELSGFIVQRGKYMAGRGAGVYANHSHAITVSNCEIHSNAGRTAGMYIVYTSDTLIVDSKIYNNHSTQVGGGIYLGNSSGAITGCTVAGNTGDQGTGGIYLTGVMTGSVMGTFPVTVADCVIACNSAPTGGGITCGPYVDAIMTNCVISGNKAVNNAGGIYNGSGHVQIVNCTIDLNTATNGGGYYAAGEAYPAWGTITNCIFSDNVGYGLYSTFMNTPTLSYSLFRMNMNTGLRGPGDYVYESYPGVATPIVGAANIDAAGYGSNDRDGSPAYSTSGLSSGTWTDNGVFDSASSTTLLTCGSANLTPGALAGKLIRPVVNQRYIYYVISNTQTTITVAGDASFCSTIGTSWQTKQYNLGSTSAAIDWGQTIAGLTHDIIGTPRPSGAGYDVGAYEYTSGPSGPMEIVWLDFPWTGAKMGTEAQPFSNIDDAINWVTVGGTIKIKPGSAAVSKRITKQVRIEAPSGGARIGAN